MSGTAHVTLRTDLLRPSVMIPNGDAMHIGFQPAPGSQGLYRLYYNALPNSRDFSRPETFSQGVQIAAFRARRSQCTVIGASHSIATGTADLVSKTTSPSGNGPSTSARSTKPLRSSSMPSRLPSPTAESPASRCPSADT